MTIAPPPIATAASHGHTVDPAASRPLAQQQTTQCARFSEFYFICITIFITPIKRHCISQKTNRVVGLQFCLLIDDISTVCVCVLHKVADTGFNNCCLLLNSIMCIFVTKMLMIWYKQVYHFPHETVYSDILPRALSKVYTSRGPLIRFARNVCVDVSPHLPTQQKKQHTIQRNNSMSSPTSQRIILPHRINKQIGQNTLVGHANHLACVDVARMHASNTRTANTHTHLRTRAHTWTWYGFVFKQNARTHIQTHSANTRIWTLNAVCVCVCVTLRILYLHLWDV